MVLTGRRDAGPGEEGKTGSNSRFKCNSYSNCDACYYNGQEGRYRFENGAEVYFDLIDVLTLGLVFLGDAGGLTP